MMDNSSTKTVQQLLTTQADQSIENWTSPEDTAPQKIVTGSLSEKLFLSFYFTFCLLYVPFCNSFLFHVVRKTPSLQTPQYFFICCYAMCDVLFSLTAHTTHLVAVVIDLTKMPEWLCRLQGSVHAGVFLTSTYALGLIAYERYCCFFKPLSYQIHFSKRRMTFLAVMPHVIGQGFSVFIELYVGRHYFTTVPGCNPSGPNLAYLNPFVICLFYLPSMAMTILCLIKLMMLVKRQSAAIVPNESVTGHHNQTLNMKKTFKIVLLVSGAYWATYVPGYIGRTVLFSGGATWPDMDTRSNMTAYALSRTFALMITTVSAVLNPIIYITLHRELRTSCLKMLKWPE